MSQQYIKLKSKKYALSDFICNVLAEKCLLIGEDYIINGIELTFESGSEKVVVKISKES